MSVTWCCAVSLCACTYRSGWFPLPGFCRLVSGRIDPRQTVDHAWITHQAARIIGTPIAGVVTCAAPQQSRGGHPTVDRTSITPGPHGPSPTGGHRAGTRSANVRSPRRRIHLLKVVHSIMLMTSQTSLFEIY